MLSPRIYLTFLVLTVSLFLHGHQAVSDGHTVQASFYKTFVSEPCAVTSSQASDLQILYADLDEEDQETESGFQALAIIPVDHFQGLNPDRHNIFHFLKAPVVYLRVSGIPLFLQHSVWRI